MFSHFCLALWFWFVEGSRTLDRVEVRTSFSYDESA